MAYRLPLNVKESVVVPNENIPTVFPAVTPVASVASAPGKSAVRELYR